MSTHLSPQRLPKLLSLCSLALIIAATGGPAALGQAKKPGKSKPGKSKPAESKPAASLRFSFDRAPWREVIQWLAKESRLGLHVEDLPTGSFTYSDDTGFTPQEAIDRVNVFLLAKKYTIVRSGKLLSIINLSDPESPQKLSVLARLVKIDELDKLSNHTVVKCFFPLGDFPAEDAAKELSALSLMTKPAVLKKTNQIFITDTVANLRSVRTALGQLKPSVLDNGTIMKTFPLQHVDADDVLIVARPHLGLATGEMIGIDVSLSADLKGKNIFVTGLADKVRLVEGLIKTIDVPGKSLTANGNNVLKSHRVAGGNIETVYNVLITMLSGKSVRLSMDETTSSVVALATPEVQNQIAKTVEQLQASDVVFEVIQLKTIDPYFAIGLLQQMLDDPEEEESQPAFTRIPQQNFGSRDNRRRDDRRRDDRRRDDRRGGWSRTRFRQRSQLPTKFQGPKIKPPKIDADPATKRLFVRATKQQIKQIKEIIALVDGPQTVVGGGDSTIRTLPMTGRRAEKILTTAARFWRRANPVILFPTSFEPYIPTEKAIHKESAQTTPQTRLRAARYLTDNLRSQSPPIRCRITARGLVMQCREAKVLTQFVKHIRLIAGPGDSLRARPTVFYLKYAKPVDALRMLAELLDGGVLSKGAEVGSLVNGSVSKTSYLGSIVTSRDGTMTMVADTVTVVADPRLNRLIAQGTVSDMEKIEGYLKIIDKDTSITSVETSGKPHVIHLEYTKATVVAATLRDAFTDRVARRSVSAGGANGQRRRNNSDSNQRNSRGREERESNDERRGDRNSSRQSRGRSSRGRNTAPSMTIAIHEPSNSLIVTAPDLLFKQVESLVKQIDVRSAKSISVMTAGPPTVQATLRQIFAKGVSRAQAGSRQTQPGSRQTGRPSGRTTGVVPLRSPRPRPQTPNRSGRGSRRNR